MNGILARGMVACAACLLLAGCGAESGAPQIGADVEKIRITHILSGQLAEWTAQGEAVDALRDWAAGLETEPRTFAEGQTPGDSDGGEVYTFTWTGEEPSELSYLIHGEDACYLLEDGTWYEVRNPSDPPVKESE